MKTRLDQRLLNEGLARSRSQAENYIRLGYVSVNQKPANKAGMFVGEHDIVKLHMKEQYVSRAGLKLASVATKLGLSFNGSVVLDVGSSTGGFTDYALQHGAKKVIAVDVGTDQMHPSLRTNQKIELHERTDIRDMASLTTPAAIAVADVSFISLRDILPHVAKLGGPKLLIVAMVKPQFEAGSKQLHKGVVKNDALRRRILKDFEQWCQGRFVIVNQADSEIEGAKGNRERFYALKPVTTPKSRRSAMLK